MEWSNRGRPSTSISVRENYDKSTDSSAAASAVTKRRKCSRKLKEDEEGSFAEVVGRSDQDDITSPLSLSGVVIALKSGGHRIYWRGRKVAYELSADEDSGFDALIKLGFLTLGIRKYNFKIYFVVIFN